MATDIWESSYLAILLKTITNTVTGSYATWDFPDYIHFVPEIGESGRPFGNRLVGVWARKRL